MDVGDASSAAADAAVGGVVGFDPAGLAGLSDVPGQSVEGALGQMLFDLGLQQDTTTQKGMQTAIGTLQSLNNLGFGNLTGFNPNNPDQTVAQIIASNNMHGFLNATVPTIMSLLGPPGTGLALNAMSLMDALQSGKATPGEAALGFGLRALGVPGFVTSALQGNMGQAASGLAQSGLASHVGNTLGISAPLAILGLNLSGIGPAVGQVVAGSVPNMPSTGILEGLSGVINKALSGFNLGSIASGTPPTSGSMQTSDSGYSADTFPVLAAIEAAAQPQQTTQPTPSFTRNLLAGRYGPIVQYEYGG